MSRALLTFAAIGLAKGINVASSLVITIVIGRDLGAAGLGRWSLVIAAATMLHTVLVAWTQPSIVRFGAEEWVRRGTLHDTLAGRAPLVLTSVTVAALVVAFDPAGLLQRLFGASSGDIRAIAAYLLGLWVAAEAQAVLQATNRLLLQARLTPLVVVLSLASLVVLRWTERLTVDTAVIAVAAASTVIWLPAWLAVLARAGVRVVVPPAAEVRRQLRYAAPLLLIGAIGYVSDWGDHLLLRWQQSVGAVGLFALAYQVLAIMMAVHSLFPTVVLPRLIAEHVRAESAMGDYLERAVPTLFTLWVLVAIWMVAIAPIALVMLAGATFRGSLATTLVLCSVVPGSAVTSLLTVLFNVQQRMPRLSVYAGGTTVTNLVLSLVLIPAFGLMGAAVGTAVSYAVGQAGYMWDQHRQLAVGAGRLWTLWAAALVAGAMQALIGEAASTRVIWAVVASVAVVWLARRVGAVNPDLLSRLMGAPLAPVVARMLVRTPMMAEPHR